MESSSTVEARSHSLTLRVNGACGSPIYRAHRPSSPRGLVTHTVEKFSACSQAVTSSGFELRRSIGAWNQGALEVRGHPILQTYTASCIGSLLLRSHQDAYLTFWFPSSAGTLT
uniref:Uncharacterized protein n=1 Tax=Mus musculus TaxID=10090 RepID=Q8CBE0_MOUSE|nr:unnamed protein product [Mus musculus]BAE28162.1 unnamed protein product [Mus musculus]